MSNFEVVICTYNNAAMLDGVLTSLARQKPARDGRWSCLVVNNNCTDRTAEVVQQHISAGAIPGLRSVRETRQGLTPARLCGVRSTGAQWTAFVDDDCFLEPDWIVNAMAFAESHPEAGAFGGKVILDWEVEPPVLRACLWLLLRGAEPRRFPASGGISCGSGAGPQSRRSYKVWMDQRTTA